MSLTRSPARPLGPDHVVRPARNGLREQQLLRRARAGDRRAREQLVTRYLPLARSLVGRYARKSEPVEDLLQVACIGLIKAIDRYDPDHGAAFTSFAVPTITGELKRHFRDRSWNVRPPRDLQEHVLRVERASDRLALRDGRAPTTAMLAAEVGIDEETVLETLHARATNSVLSLDRPLDGDETHTLADTTACRDDDYEAAEQRVLLAQLEHCISARERAVLHMRFRLDMTQAEIGAVIGVSQMQISRIIRSALQRLREVAKHYDDAAAG